ncbi:unnamed protein product [Meganyctiphanes norvegica]|uniref:Odorant receptor n=1 Tax=Meganyctiphanes norvegica TaxID=48144 RepID=A0AAV2SUZ6_MEGNR
MWKANVKTSIQNNVLLCVIYYVSSSIPYDNLLTTVTHLIMNKLNINYISASDDITKGNQLLTYLKGVKHNFAHANMLNITQPLSYIINMYMFEPKYNLSIPFVVNHFLHFSEQIQAIIINFHSFLPVNAIEKIFDALVIDWFTLNTSWTILSNISGIILLFCEIKMCKFVNNKIMQIYKFIYLMMNYSSIMKSDISSTLVHFQVKISISIITNTSSCIFNLYKYSALSCVYSHCLTESSQFYDICNVYQFTQVLFCINFDLFHNSKLIYLRKYYQTLNYEIPYDNHNLMLSEFTYALILDYNEDPLVFISMTIFHIFTILFGNYLVTYLKVPLLIVIAIYYVKTQFQRNRIFPAEIHNYPQYSWSSCIFCSLRKFLALSSHYVFSYTIKAVYYAYKYALIKCIKSLYYSTLYYLKYMTKLPSVLHSKHCFARFVTLNLFIAHACPNHVTDFPGLLGSVNSFVI